MCSRRGTSALENYHKGQHKCIVGMKVGVQLAHRSLVNYQYRTLLAARAKSGDNYKEYATFNQMLLVESNTASGRLFPAAFAGLSEPKRPLTADHFVGGIKSISDAAKAEKVAKEVAAVEAEKAAKEAEAAAKLVASSSMAAAAPLPKSPTACTLEDAGTATMDSVV